MNKNMNVLFDKYEHELEESYGLIPTDLKPSGWLTGEYSASEYLLLRLHYVSKYGFVWLDRKLISDVGNLLKGKKVLSLMSGTCCMEYNLFVREGIDIIATDDFSWDWAINQFQTELIDLGRLKRIDAVEAVYDYGNDVDVFLISWPPYLDDIAARVVDTIHEVNPNAKILYFGELDGGNCANDNFFMRIRGIEHIPIRSFPAIHDKCVLCEIDQEYYAQN